MSEVKYVFIVEVHNHTCMLLNRDVRYEMMVLRSLHEQFMLKTLWSKGAIILIQWVQLKRAAVQLFGEITAPATGIISQESYTIPFITISVEHRAKKLTNDDSFVETKRWSPDYRPKVTCLKISYRIQFNPPSPSNLQSTRNSDTTYLLLSLTHINSHAVLCLCLSNT